MAKNKSMSDLEIVARLHIGKPFTVFGDMERRRVLNAARFVELPHKVTTRGDKAKKVFTVLFIP